MKVLINENVKERENPVIQLCVHMCTLRFPTREMHNYLKLKPASSPCSVKSTFVSVFFRKRARAQ